MQLKNRIASLERSRSGPCSICDGKGKLVYVQKQEGDPDPPIDPATTCPGCGRYHVLYLLWVDEDAMGRRREKP